MVSRSLLRVLILFAVAGLGVLAACSSSERAAAPEASAADEATPAGPSLSLLYVTDDGTLALHEARDERTESLAEGITDDGPRAVSPSGQRLAFSYATADSTHLAFLDRTDGTLQPVHARPGTVTYSLAWHPTDDRLAFAYYEPAEEGTRGPGAVRVASSDGTHRSVGCSAAREVLAWLPDGALATRDDDNLYVVDPEDCATHADADARRMHEATYAPTGDRLAYIHRELSYDSDAREYTPDSSLHLADARVARSTEILRPDRRPRHLRWGPDGGELAAGVYEDASGRRQIVAYNVEEDRTVFLTPPASTTRNQSHPRWSPDGERIAFTRGRGDNAVAAVRMQGQTRTLGPVDEAVWGWLDAEAVVVPGPDSVRVKTLSNDTRFSHPAPAALLDVWTDAPA